VSGSRKTYLGSVSSISRWISSGRSIGPQMWGCGESLTPNSRVAWPSTFSESASTLRSSSLVPFGARRPMLILKCWHPK
jgi:hypothetical protein